MMIVMFESSVFLVDIYDFGRFCRNKLRKICAHEKEDNIKQNHAHILCVYSWCLFCKEIAAQLSLQGCPETILAHGWESKYVLYSPGQQVAELDL